MPEVVPLTENNTGAREDRLEGTVIVAEDESLNFVVTTVVNSDPCPSIFWTFEGANITSGDMYTFNDPCSVAESSSPYTFTLTIANLTAATSGRYSAALTNLAGSVNLPGLLVSIPSKNRDSVLGYIPYSLVNSYTLIHFSFSSGC